MPATYGGGTNLDAGILRLGSAGAIPATGTISPAGGTLQYTMANTTDYSANFSNNAGQLYRIDTNGQNVTFGTGLGSVGGSLTKLGTGTLTLAVANTFTGATNVNAGTLDLQALNALQNSTVSLNGGTVVFDMAVGGNAFTFGGLTGGGNLALVNNAAPATAITLTVGNNGTSNTYFGVLSGAGNLNVAGSGILTLTGANTYTGTTTLSGGELSLGSAGALGGIGSMQNIFFGGGALQFTGANTTDYSGNFSPANNQAYKIDTNNQNVTFAHALNSTGGTLTKIGAGQLKLSAPLGNDYDGSHDHQRGDARSRQSRNAVHNSTVSLSGGTLAFESSVSPSAFTLGGLAGSGNLTLANNAASPVAVALTVGNNNSSNNYSGVLSGPGSLTVTGSGVFTLMGANTFTGATNVNAGTLDLKNPNALQSSAVSLNGGAVVFDMAVGGNAFTFGGLTGSGNLTLVNNATPTAVPITLTVGGNNSSNTYSGALSGAGNLTVTGAGAFTLTGANTYTGGTTVSGTLLAQEYPHGKLGHRDWCGGRQ